MGSKKDKIKLPLQLASLIQREGGNLPMMLEEDVAAVGGMAVVDEEEMDREMVDVGDGSVAGVSVPATTVPPSQQRSLNSIVHAAQVRHVKELQNYVRAVCKRMGFDD
jgi:serine kinase of HPr protein (carbohydrate metabolism regulator)